MASVRPKKKRSRGRRGARRSTTKAVAPTRLWSAKVKPHWHPPPGLFAKGSAKEIAATLLEEAPDERTAMSRLTFYMNRAGHNLSAAQRKRLETAKKIVHAAA
jgi:hypothetical protein